MLIAIESSCDESAIALFDPDTGIVGEWVHSQLDLHREYGGVVPDLASRQHLENFCPLLEELNDLPLDRVTKIAVTCGPGLAGCLALGIAFAKSLALALDVPLMGVNHLRGHAYSPFISLHHDCPSLFESVFSESLPHLGLIVSGGNTLLFEINTQKEIKVIASTVDDAAGEALDKGAKLLGLEYPGGPIIERMAQKGDPKAYHFPRAFPENTQMKFSFSGLKTSLRYRLEKLDEMDDCLPDIAASYQEAVIEQLTRKVAHVLEKKSYASLGLSGGVANNSRLRDAFSQLGKEHKLAVYIAQKQHTGDNAAMIAFAAYADPAGLKAGERLSFNPSWTLA